MTLDNSTKGILFATGTAFSWGLQAIILKVAVLDIDPVTVSCFRLTGSALWLFLFYALFKKKDLLKLKQTPYLTIFAGIILSVNFFGFSKGLQLTGATNAQVIMQSAPIALALLGIFYFKEKVYKWQIMGFILSISGLYMFYRDQLSINPFQQEATYNQGTLLILLGAFTWVIYATIQKVLVNKHDTNLLSLVVYFISGICLTPFVDFSVFTGLTLKIWLIMTYLSFSTLLAYGFLNAALKYTDANKVSVIITTNPLITILLMTIFASMEATWVAPEIITPLGLLSALMVITGAIFASKKSKKRFKRTDFD